MRLGGWGGNSRGLLGETLLPWGEVPAPENEPAFTWVVAMCLASP